VFVRCAELLDFLPVFVALFEVDVVAELVEQLDLFLKVAAGDVERVEEFAHQSRGRRSFGESVT